MVDHHPLLISNKVVNFGQILSISKRFANNRGNQ